MGNFCHDLGEVDYTVLELPEALPLPSSPAEAEVSTGEARDTGAIGSVHNELALRVVESSVPGCVQRMHN